MRSSEKQEIHLKRFNSRDSESLRKKRQAKTNQIPVNPRLRYFQHRLRTGLRRPFLFQLKEPSETLFIQEAFLSEWLRSRRFSWTPDYDLAGFFLNFYYLTFTETSTPAGWLDFTGLPFASTFCFHFLTPLIKRLTSLFDFTLWLVDFGERRISGQFWEEARLIG